MTSEHAQMSAGHNVHSNSVMLKAIAANLLLSAAQIELKIASTRQGATIRIFGIDRQATDSFRFIHGSLFCLFALAGVALWSNAIKDTELTRIYWTTAVVYLVVPMISSVILGERLTLQNVVGYGIILIGLVIAGKG